MTFIIGFITVFGCVAGGYAMHHGNFAILWQPSEVVIICGASFGAFIIANPLHVVIDTGKSLKNLFKIKPYNKKDYIQLLVFLFTVFKLMKTKGMLEMEAHIENPKESEIFQKFPKVLGNHHAVDFFCDYVRMMTMGVDNYHQAEDLMDADLESHHHESHQAAHAVVAIGEGLPAIGIVAAVLGVITTMGSISEPPEVLGGLIGAALVGTFLGVLLSYGLVGPMGSYIEKYGDAESKYMECIKAGIIAYMQGNAPSIAIEYARKQIPSHERPSFKEVEESLG